MCHGYVCEVFNLSPFICLGYVFGVFNLSRFVCHRYVCGVLDLSRFVCHGYVCGVLNLFLFHSLQDKVLKFFAKTSSSSPFNLTREIYSSLGTHVKTLSFAVAIICCLTPSELRLKAWWKVECFMSFFPSYDAQSALIIIQTWHTPNESCHS